MSARLYRLTELHQRIDTALRREITHRAPDQLKVVLLKKKKLRIKDMIHRLSRRSVMT